MISHPIVLLALFITLVRLIFLVARTPAGEKLFRFAPVPFWCYFIATLLSTAGLIASSSPLYAWMSRLLLPACLLLLLIGTDLPAIARISPRALFAMAAGSAGIFLGGLAVFTLAPSNIPDLWSGWACLSASWTGGSTNMVSVKEILQTPDSLFSGLIIVDAIIAYSWMALLVMLSRHQNLVDRWLSASPLPQNPELSKEETQTAAGKPASCLKSFTLAAAAFALAAVLWGLSGLMPEYGPVINRFTWLIIFSTALPLALASTRARSMESWGGARSGNFLLYLLLASIGAKADLRSLAQAPQLVLMGFLWVGIHGLVLLAYGRLTRTPLALLATASQANIGGTVSAPLVASIYDRRLAPVGLMMAVLGGIYGTYAALALSEICRRLTGLL